MSHVITDNCDSCKFTKCVVVCPVDCIYESNSQLVINFDDCIDCEACVAECPVEAIYEESKVPANKSASIDFNRQEGRRLVNSGAKPIVAEKFPLPTAEEKKKRLGF